MKIYEMPVDQIFEKLLYYENWIKKEFCRTFKGFKIKSIQFHINLSTYMRWKKLDKNIRNFLKEILQNRMPPKDY